MTSRWTRPSRRLLGVLLATSALLLAVPIGSAGWARRLFGSLLEPGQQVATAAASGVRGLASTWQAAELSRRDVETLRAELHSWRNRYVETRQQLVLERREHERLLYLGDQPSLLRNVLVPAIVLGHDTVLLLDRMQVLSAGTSDNIRPPTLALDGTELCIDRGRRAGVDQGQTVFDGRAVVGRVIEAGPHTSLLQPLAHPDFIQHAQLMWIDEDGQERYGAKGILKGAGNGLCHLTRVASTVQLRNGDWVMTTGHQGVLPRALVYGRITHCERKPHDLNWQITVTPAADLDNIRRVFVVTADLAGDHVASR